MAAGSRLRHSTYARRGGRGIVMKGQNERVRWTAVQGLARYQSDNRASTSADLAVGGDALFHGQVVERRRLAGVGRELPDYGSITKFDAAIDFATLLLPTHILQLTRSTPRPSQSTLPASSCYVVTGDG